jgi:hypothetical protein
MTVIYGCSFVEFLMKKTPALAGVFSQAVLWEIRSIARLAQTKHSTALNIIPCAAKL